MSLRTHTTRWPGSRRWLGAAVAVLCVASLAVGIVIFWEAVYVGFLAPRAVVDGYIFGSEAMVVHGGWGYESKARYLVSGLLKGLAFSAPPIAVRLGRRRRKAR